MKKSILYQIFILLGILIAGCDENGDDGYYDNAYRVYFPKTSMLCKLGTEPATVTRYTVNVPVSILGLGAKEGMKVKVKVDPQKTTAGSDLYATIPEEIEFKKDSIVTYIPVELLRDNITSEKDSTFQICLTLVANEYFALGIKENLGVEIKFTNYLGRPSWWGVFEQYIGRFHQKKYLKLMEIWGGEVTLLDVAAKEAKLILVCKEMYDFFMKNPEDGVVLPLHPMWPYE